jgi:HKD family nuclease
MTAPVEPATPRRTLVGDGNAFVAGLPTGFDLADALKKAENIQLAMAFAGRSGWRHFREAVSKGVGSVFLLTGLDLQTEPELLGDWLELQSNQPRRIRAKIALKDPFFHPKVLIVTGPGKSGKFAVVGSGNLSQGGIQDNTECCVYVRDAGIVEQLAAWFGDEFKRARQLSPFAIKEYERFYVRNRGRRRKLQDERLAAQKIVDEWNPPDALLREAKTYFASPKWAEEDCERWQRGREEILEAIRYPNFTFDASGFKKFFSIRTFGGLSHFNRKTIFSKAHRIKKGLRALIANTETNLPLVLDKGRRFYVPGFGLNAVSKVLAAYDPKSWPVLNKLSRRRLDDFGYSKPRGSSKSEEYLRFRDAMEKVKEDCRREGCGDLDALALDAFLVRHPRTKRGKQKSRGAGPRMQRHN